MHRTPLARTQYRTLPRRPRRLRPCALENWLSWHGTSRRRARPADRRGRSFVHRTRSSLRHDHAGRGSRGRSRFRRSDRRRRRCLLGRRGTRERRRRCGLRRNRNGRWWRRTRTWRSRRCRCRRRLWRNHNDGRRPLCRYGSGGHEPWRWWRLNRRLGRRRLRGSGRSLGLRFRRGCGRRGRLGCRTRRRMLCFFLFLCNRAQHVAGTRDMREVNLGLEFVFTVRARRLRARGGGFGMSTEMLPD